MVHLCILFFQFVLVANKGGGGGLKDIGCANYMVKNNTYTQKVVFIFCCFKVVKNGEAIFPGCN